MKRRHIIALAFLAPNLIGFMAFKIIPVAMSLWLAFTNYDLRLHNPFKHAPIRFVGFENFLRLFTHPDFWRFFGNTVFLMIGIPFAIAASLWAALLLHRDLKSRAAGIGVAAGVLFISIILLVATGGGVSALLLLLGAIVLGGACGGTKVYRTLFYLPQFTSGLAVFILWKKIYNPHTGPLAQLLHFVGLSSPEWLNNYYWAKPALMLISFWAAIGSNNMLLYLAGLANVPHELYEVADIDGASRWQRFWNVTWPQLAPVTCYIVVLNVVGGLQGGFEMAKALTNGGPAGATTTLSYFMYTEGFEAGRLGFASAVVWIVLVLALAATWINSRFGSHYVHV
jgi:multiple sugar transport system permease protein